MNMYYIEFTQALNNANYTNNGDPYLRNIFSEILKNINAVSINKNGTTEIYELDSIDVEFVTIYVADIINNRPPFYNIENYNIEQIKNTIISNVESVNGKITEKLKQLKNGFNLIGNNLSSINNIISINDYRNIKNY